MRTLELKKSLKLIQENKCPSHAESKISKILGLHPQCLTLKEFLWADGDIAPK